MRPARYLHLAAIVAFILAVIALALGESLAATVMFIVAAVGFLTTLILQRRRQPRPGTEGAGLTKRINNKAHTV
jgi:multisubunit Na+/H+ antiporter MnhF subunit